MGRRRESSSRSTTPSWDLTSTRSRGFSGDQSEVFPSSCKRRSVSVVTTTCQRFRTSTSRMSSKSIPTPRRCSSRSTWLASPTYKWCSLPPRLTGENRGSRSDRNGDASHIAAPSISYNNCHLRLTQTIPSNDSICIILEFGLTYYHYLFNLTR